MFFHVKKAWSWHQGIAKIRQNPGKLIFEGLKSRLLCYFIINIGLRPDGPLAPIIGLINYVDSQSKFNDLVANKAFIHNEWVRGISNNAGNLYFKGVKITLLIYLFLDFASHSLSMHAQNDFFPALYGHCQTVVCAALD